MPREVRASLLAGALLLGALIAAAPASGAFPLSKNGKLFFGSLGGGNFDIHSINTNGSGTRNLTGTPAPIDEFGPSISPNGRLIAYTRDEHGPNSSDLWVMSADGSGQRPLFPPTTDVDEGPAFSPDGRRIAFARCNSGECDIYVVSINGTGLHPVTAFPAGGGAFDPTFSPNGRRIAFQRYVSGAGPSDIWTINSGGGGELNLTNKMGRAHD